MKILRFIPLLFLTACSTTPKLTLRPQLPPPATDNSGIRNPEVVHGYHFARYVDPNDDLVMHERHVVYRVEENTRWNLHSLPPGDFTVASLSSRDSAFSPAPVNDAVLAEVNSQRLATAQIMMQARILSAALAEFQNDLRQAKTNFQETASLRTTINEMKQRIDALETAQAQLPVTSISTNNEPADSLAP
jgi:hypothetical protein